MAGDLARLKGFADLYGSELDKYALMEEIARLIFPRYGFGEIRPPVLESTSLFQRGIGAETDVVKKEMFTFEDRKGRSLTLRPEATAGVLRAAAAAGLARPGQIARLFTIGPMFRYERPQKGRMRQFHQINAECLGSDSPYADVELIGMLMQFLRQLDLTDLTLKINSLGCRDCRPDYLRKLRDFLGRKNSEDFCEDCQRRMESNTLRVLDCKICQPLLDGAPAMTESLCPDCAAHFSKVMALLERANIACEIEARLVRGLDYYMRTTFEVVSGAIGAQTAVAGGGRYDGLMALIGGLDVPGVGFACGMERLALLMPSLGMTNPDFYIIGLTEECRDAAWQLAAVLREAGFAGEMNYNDASMKSLLRMADHAHARYAVIMGPDELAQGMATVKNLGDGAQRHVALADVAAAIERQTNPADKA